MYAIVKTGGKQYKVAEGDVITVEKLDNAPGDEVSLPALLLVDGEAVTHDAEQLANRRGRGPHQGPEDPHPQVQEEDALPQAAGSPSAPHRGEDHRGGRRGAREVR